MILAIDDPGYNYALSRISMREVHLVLRPKTNGIGLPLLESCRSSAAKTRSGIVVSASVVQLPLPSRQTSVLTSADLGGCLCSWRGFTHGHIHMSEEQRLAV